MTAEKWAASACFGVIAALFPVIGPVTLICIGVCSLARLNLPLVLLILYGLYPLQLALILPFTWLGSLLTGWQLPADFGFDDIRQVSKRLGAEGAPLGNSCNFGLDFGRLTACIRTLPVATSLCAADASGRSLIDKSHDCLHQLFGIDSDIGDSGFHHITWCSYNFEGLVDGDFCF